MVLKINIHDIRERKAAEIRDSLVLSPEELDLPEAEGFQWHPLRFDYVLTNADNLYVLHGVVKGQLSLECSRCLKPIDYHLDVELTEQFSRRPSDDDIHEFTGDEIDVTGVLRENIILALPVKPLCAPDCRGLCPECGQDQNEGKCSCDPKSIDPRLAVLEKLISK